MKRRVFEDLKGQTLKSIQRVDDEKIIFTLLDGRKYELYHENDCCETVTIEDVTGDLNDLVGVPLLQAEESTNTNDPKLVGEYQDVSFTWTFYKLATHKGYVTIRWYGSSNGYYSESVDFREVPS